jgi:cystathionine beta-lyase/cystathionine gamma-synthase
MRYVNIIAQRPLSLGADIVFHAASKYLNGHSDSPIGVVLHNSTELDKKFKWLQES